MLAQLRQDSARKRWAVIASSMLALCLTSCGEGSGGSPGGGGGPIVIDPAPIPSPNPTPTPDPTPSPTPSPSPTGWAGQAAALYDTLPDPASCRAGTLKASVQNEMLARVNGVRALHGLPAITYSNANNQGTADSSLMMAVNRALNHTPPTSWTCYTSAGYNAAGSSNLIGGWGNGLPWSSEDDLLAGWMNERNSASIGHRRWILDPFLGQITYGRAAYQNANGSRSDAATLKVFGFPTSVPAPAPASLPGFVAYPQGNYPLRYFGAGDILSFSVIANKTDRYANSSVRFDNATVTVSAGGTNLAVTQIAKDNEGYGLANNIQWRVTGLQPSTTYAVRIAGVTGAPQTSYDYSFRITP